MSLFKKRPNSTNWQDEDYDVTAVRWDSSLPLPDSRARCLGSAHSVDDPTAPPPHETSATGPTINSAAQAGTGGGGGGTGGAGGAPSKPLGGIPELAYYLTDDYWNRLDSDQEPHHFDHTLITYNIEGLATQAEKTLALTAMSQWHDVCGVTFSMTTADNADITYIDDESDDGANTKADTSGTTENSAVVDIPSSWVANYGTGIDSYSFQTYIHETGHALGLGHQGPYNFNGTYASDAAFANDTWQYSVMSYWDQSNFEDGSKRYVMTPQMADIYAVTTLYGAGGARAHDTTYGFNVTAANVGTVYDFSTFGVAPAMTIFDAGGNDTLDFSQYSQDQTIDLRPGDFSSVGGLVHNIGIYLTTTIENATGGGGNDTIFGNSANNVLKGLNGNDILNGLGGADYMDGSGGNDTFYVDNPGDVVVDSVVPGLGGTDLVKSTVDYTLPDNIENLTLLGSGNLNGTGNDLANRIIGNSGDNDLKGGGGADTLSGGGGIDTAIYADSDAGVTVYLNGSTAGSGGTAEGDILTGIENIYGSAYDDVLEGGLGANKLTGNGGNDILNGGAGADILDGGLGSDTASYLGAPAAVIACLNNPGANTGYAAGDTYISIENLSGTAYDDTLVGDGNANTLSGGGGNDLLKGGGGADHLDGGLGTDTVDYSLSDAAVTVSLLSGSGSGGDAQGNTLVGIENLVGSHYADHLTGDGGNNDLNGNVGADVMAGGGGNDIYHVDNAADAVLEAANAGSDTVMTTVSYALAAGQAVENLTCADTASTTAINLSGNTLAQAIIGNAGTNTIYDGGAGAADGMAGLGGDDDVYLVCNAGDLVSETAGGGNDKVEASVSYKLSAGQEIETLSTQNDISTTAIDLTGNTLAQTIVGNAGGNHLDDGGAGSPDTMKGLGGDDIYYVNNTHDQVLEAAGAGNDMVYSSVSYILGTGQEVESLASAGSNVSLTGNEQAQTILGDAGNNRIDGMRGSDVLKGGAGTDTFVFDSTLSATTNVDQIADFAVGTDMIELSHAIFSTLSTGHLSADAFDIGSSAHDASDRIVYNAKSGALLYDADGTGAGAAVQFASLTPSLSNLSATSFRVA